MINSVLIDINSYNDWKQQIANEIQSSDFIGLDIETHDDGRHDGLNRYCGYNPSTRMKKSGKPLVFDVNRTKLCGISIYPEGYENAYYFNIEHADSDNRLEWEKVESLLNMRKANSYFVCHNLAFELTMLAKTVGYDLWPAIDTFQMAVSAWNPDQYDRNSFMKARADGIRKFQKPLFRKSAGFDRTRKIDEDLADIIFKITAKNSTADHSYNGFVKSISPGYGLKSLVEYFFNHKMTTFEQALQGKAHMGQLTGLEVVDYGAEDAFWAVKLFRKILEWMATHNPDVIRTFFDQENVMIPIYSSIWQNGWRVDYNAITAYRDTERKEFAKVIRQLQQHVFNLLPFDNEPNNKLEKHEEWYRKNYQSYRKKISDWACKKLPENDLHTCLSVRGPVSNELAEENGVAASDGPNFSHYMPIRMLLYDLIGADLIWSDGKIQSNGDARGRVRDKLSDSDQIGVVDCLAQIAGIEQLMKLYVTPYLQLTDPETGRMYPNVSSSLATRRMAASYPNPMQIAKRGEGSTVRGFFLPDEDDHVLVSLDWSAIELVDIGEKSQDPEFLRAYGSLPHQDLHAGATADILKVEVPDLDEATFKSLKSATEWPDIPNIERIKRNIKGEELPIEKAYSYWRTEIGKGANFNYWYSGFLGTIGERMGWSLDKTDVATNRYRERFMVAEQWRRSVIEDVKDRGYVTLPDHHRRYRFEATQQWFDTFTQKFVIEGMDDYNNVIRYIASKIQKRSFNQAVNSMIQGSCATLAKRSAYRIVKRIKEDGFDARFIIPIHDELVFSVHKDQVVSFIKMARHEMTNHPDLYKHVALDASASVGLTFEPWSTKTPIGQIELMELPKIGVGTPGAAANDNEISDIVGLLFDIKRTA